MSVQRWKQAWKRTVVYVKYDLREIVLPSSLPDPADWPVDQGSRFSVRRLWKALVLANKEYVNSWKSPSGQQIPEGRTKAAADGERPLAEELAAVARGGAKTVRPYMQQLYSSRATLYRDSLQEFVKGYKEGLADEHTNTQGQRSDKTDRAIPEHGDQASEKQGNGSTQQPPSPRS